MTMTPETPRPPAQPPQPWMIEAAKELTSIWHEVIHRVFKDDVPIEDRTSQHFAEVIASHAPKPAPVAPLYEVAYHDDTNPKWVVRIHHGPYVSYHYIRENAEQVCVALNLGKQLERDLAAHDADLADLRRTCAELVTDSNAITLAQSLQRKDAENAALRERVAFVEKAREHDMDSACANERNLRAQLQAATEKVAQLEGALALGQANCDDVYNDLKRERDVAKSKLCIAIREHGEAMQAATERAEKAERELNRAAEVIEEYYGKLCKAEQRAAALERECKQLKAQRDDCAIDATKAEQEVVILRGLYDGTKPYIEQLERDLPTARADCAKWRECAEKLADGAEAMEPIRGKILAHFIEYHHEFGILERALATYRALSAPAAKSEGGGREIDESSDAITGGGDK